MITDTTIKKDQEHRAIANLQTFVATDMDAVDKLILASVGSHVELIPEITKYLVESGGKRIRPLLTLATALLCGYEGNQHITMATSVEFMHTATLLHDDVVDDSVLRRGKKTARLLWGNQASVLVGDYLLGKAFEMMVSVGKIDALECLAKAASTIAEGEVLQLSLAYSLESSADEYRRVIDAKTAALFVAACEVGAILADQDRQTRKALATFGRHLGVAFQLSDDVLDYMPGEALGKRIGDDFHEGKVTLPVILAFERGKATEKSFWQKAFSRTQEPSDANQQAMLAEAIDLIDRSEARESCIQFARDEADQAVQALEHFAPGDLFEALVGTAKFAAERCRL